MQLMHAIAPLGKDALGVHALFSVELRLGGLWWGFLNVKSALKDFPFFVSPCDELGWSNEVGGMGKQVCAPFRVRLLSDQA